MGIDVWEVVDAAATKPFGFMSFKPGPGLGGHCIPLDPYYLSWKAREFDFNTRFVELAGEINNNMPYFCRSVISQALNHGARSRCADRRSSSSASPTRPTSTTSASRRPRRSSSSSHRGRRRRLPRPACARVRRPDLRATRARRLRLRRDRHRALVDRLRGRRRARKVIVDFRNATKGYEVDGKVWKL